MLSGYMCISLGAGRRRLCQAASVIAVCMLWLGQPASVHAGVEDASLRGALNKPLTEETLLSEHSEAAETAPPSPDRENDHLLDVICEKAGKNEAIIRSKEDGVVVRCKGAFAVYDVADVGEVFGPDCKSPKPLDNESMKAVLDHSVDDRGAFRTISVASFPSEDEQFCLVCALEEDAAFAGAKEVPENHTCSVIVTVLGRNNKANVPEDATPEVEQVPEHVPEEQTTAETQIPQGQQPVSSVQLLEARSSEQAMRPQRNVQRVGPRQPQQQQQLEQQPEEEISRHEDVADNERSEAPIPEEEQGAEHLNKAEEQREEGAQVEGQQNPAEENQKVETENENPDKAEDAESLELKENTTKPPLQCMNVDLHLDVGAGESISFTCGEKQQLIPDTIGFVYEESEGKCGTVPKSISELVPEAEITKADDALTVALLFGDSDEKTVCYKCVRQTVQEGNKETDTEGETAADQSTECEVYITLKPGIAPATRVASSASAPSTSYLISIVLFLGALLHLL